MINDDLIKYIETQKGRGITREAISQKLSDAGWKVEDINEGLSKVFVATEVTSTPAASPTLSPVAATRPEALTPNLMPKVVGPAGAVPIKNFELSSTLNANSGSTVDPRSSAFDSFRPEQKPQPTPTATIMSPGPLPQGAVISSYRKEYQNLETISGEPKKHWGQFALILILILALLAGGVIFASIKGYIQLPFEIPFIKPTPEQAMAKMMVNTSKLQTAHFDTEINFSLVTTTTFKEISLGDGLPTDTALPANNTFKPADQKNEINLKVSAQTDYDNTDPASSKSDTKINIKFPSDFLGIGDVESEFISIGDAGYIRLPELDFIKQFAGDTKWVYVSKSDLSDQRVITPLNTIAPFVGAYDLEKEKKLKALFTDTDFIGQIVEVGVEEIDADPTYHYQIVVGKDKIKNVVTKAIDIIDSSDMVEGKNDILNGLENVSDMKIDLWVTKGTYFLRKVSVALSNEIVSSRQSGQTTSKTTVAITQLISKINEPIQISIPTGAKTINEIQKEYDAMPDVVNSKIKANLYGFEPEAALFFDGHANSYGKANTTGSCVVPVKDSVFENSASIKNTLELSGGLGSCYSTAKAYAVSIPLAGGINISMCMDSKGVKKETAIPLTGTVCK